MHSISVKSAAILLSSFFLVATPSFVDADTTETGNASVKVGTLSDYEVSDEIKRNCHLKEGVVYRFFAMYFGDSSCPVPCVTRYCVKTTSTTTSGTGGSGPRDSEEP